MEERDQSECRGLCGYEWQWGVMSVRIDHLNSHCQINYDSHTDAYRFIGYQVATVAFASEGQSNCPRSLGLTRESSGWDWKQSLICRSGELAVARGPIGSLIGIAELLRATVPRIRLHRSPAGRVRREVMNVILQSYRISFW